MLSVPVLTQWLPRSPSDPSAEEAGYRGEVLRLLITPRWLALTSVLLLIVVAFAWLGMWQWSRGVTTTLTPDNTATGAFQPLRAVHEQGVPVERSTAGTPVVVRGEYVTRDELYVPQRLQVPPSPSTSQEKEPAAREGYWVLTPLEVAPGEVIPIVRGWVSSPNLSSPPPTGAVTVKGLLQASESDALREGFADELGGDEIALVSSPELLSRWEGRLWQGFVLLQSQEPDDPASVIEPVREPPPLERTISWQSLAYSVQWWLFAAFAVFFFWRMLSLEHETSVRSASDPAEGHV